MSHSASLFATWGLVALATAGVILRPFRWPEAVWACAGAVLLVALGLAPLAGAVRAAARGLDVYLFLIGMMLLSETARREGVFEALAARAVNLARGSTGRLFLLVYAIGVAVTVFLSNDATAVVLTPAVFAAARRARADPLPLLYVCAFVANAASFVLPISNPANLVLFDGQIPPLAAWMARFALPSAVAIPVTFAALRWVERRRLAGACAAAENEPRLGLGGWTTLAGIAATGAGLLIVSGLGLPLGPPTFGLGAATAGVVLLGKRAAPWRLLGGVAWQVVPLVAGLFVMVEALDQTGVIAALAAPLGRASGPGAAAGVGALTALATNVMNNLPAGLIASAAVAQAHPPRAVVDALMIGVDLGPNLSITGSLATILWLTAIRREGERVGFWRFLAVGAVVMPPALAGALAARLLLG